MLIRLAKETEYEKVVELYFKVTDDMENAEYKPGWQKEVYPEFEYLKKSIEAKQLFVGEKNGKFISAMIVNSDTNEGYSKVNWKIEAQKEDFYIIHALCVSVDYQGKGIAKEMVNFVLEKAKKDNKKAVRLDVLNGNIPALRLYEGCGFKYIDTVNMFYEDTGYTDFLLYEYVVK